MMKREIISWQFTGIVSAFMENILIERTLIELALLLYVRTLVFFSSRINFSPFSLCPIYSPMEWEKYAIHAANNECLHDHIFLEIHYS